MEKLQWKVKHDVDFTNEIDFLETILKSNGITDIVGFLNPSKRYELNPFDLDNMQEGIELLHNNLNKKIFIKVDCDVDGFTSSAYLRQFIEKLNSQANIEYRLNFNKEHGLFYEDVAHYKKDELGLIIVPDASVTNTEAQKIKENLGDVPILIIDHHEVEKDNAGLFDLATLINCSCGKYQNKCLSGVGVVHKFCLAYCQKYNIDEDIANYFLDLVGLGIVADSMDLTSLENRYYITQGFENIHNEFMKEMMLRDTDNYFRNELTIYSAGWYMAPLINATIRYGKPEEQIDLFRAMCGEQETRAYQPRRKSKNDPKPPVEIHSLQKTMARVCANVKSRQDNEVRKFMEKTTNYVEENNLLNNSVLIIDGTDLLPKKTVTGLVANKLASKYKRPVIMLKSFDDETFGGSCRNYGEGKIENLKQFLEQFNIFEFLAGHPNACGYQIKKDRIEELQKQCNKSLLLSDLVTIHEVDYEVLADDLKLQDIKNVADSYAIWGNNIKEPLFAITNLHISAKNISSYGDNNSFIRFVYKGIPFIKKYCSKTDYDNMVLKDRRTLGVNKKDLNLNLICSFVLNEYEGKVSPQVKIWYFDSEEYIPSENENMEFVF